MKLLLRSWRDAHKCSTSTADLSKQLEKGHKRYSSLIYIFPQVTLVLKGTVRAMESHLCRQPSNCGCSGCHRCQGRGQSRYPVLDP